MIRTIHAARPGLTGDHRTDGLRCRCDPIELADLNEPGRRVLVHRPMPPRPDELAKAAMSEAETLIRADPSSETGDFTLAHEQKGATDR